MELLFYLPVEDVEGQCIYVQGFPQVFLSQTGEDLFLLPWRTPDEDVKDVDSATHYIQVRKIFKCH